MPRVHPLFVSLILLLLAACSSETVPEAVSSPLAPQGKAGPSEAVPSAFVGVWHPHSASAGARGIEISRKGFIREFRPAGIGVTQTGMTDIRVIKATPTELWLLGRTPYANGGSIVSPQKLYLSPGGQLTYTIGRYCGLTELEWQAKTTQMLELRQQRYPNCRFETLFGASATYRKAR